VVILDRYIGKTVAFSVMMVMAVLLALYVFTSMANEVNKIGHGTYTALNAVEYILSQLPRRIYEFFPLSALLGTMIGLGGLASRSELIVIRTTGVSVGRIVISVMKTALILMIVATFFGEVIAPPVDQYVKARRVKQLARQIDLNTSYGLWARDGDTFINVRRVETSGRLVGVNLYRFDDQHRLHTVIHANSARRQGEGWILSRVRESLLTDDGVTTRQLAQMQWHTILSPELIGVVSVSPTILAFWDLLDYVHYLHRNGLNAERYELALWQKAVAPFTVGAMVLLAVPFVFGSLRSVGMGARILVGFLVGVSFYMLNQIAGHAGLVYHIPPAVSAGLPTLLVMTISLVLLRRVR